LKRKDDNGTNAGINSKDGFLSKTKTSREQSALNAQAGTSIASIALTYKRLLYIFSL